MRRSRPRPSPTREMDVAQVGDEQVGWLNTAAMDALVTQLAVEPACHSYYTIDEAHKGCQSHQTHSRDLPAAGRRGCWEVRSGLVDVKHLGGAPRVERTEHYCCMAHAPAPTRQLHSRMNPAQNPRTCNYSVLYY